MTKQISILGTGWLGLPLSLSLKKYGYIIKGSTTSSEKLTTLAESGILGFQILLEEKGPKGNVIDFLAESDTLIINIPPGLRSNPDSNFIGKVKNFVPFIEKSDVRNVLFISSTSVYSDAPNFPLLTEKVVPKPSTNSGRQLLETEHLLQSNKNFLTTTLRFGGLYDQRRHPATALSKKSKVKNPLAPVNLIHLEDCIHIILKIVQNDQWNQVFNAAFPEHPTKAIYYTRVCKTMGISVPDFDYDQASQGKVISCNKIETVLPYTFRTKL